MARYPKPYTRTPAFGADYPGRAGMYRNVQRFRGGFVFKAHRLFVPQKTQVWQPPPSSCVPTFAKNEFRVGREKATWRTEIKMFTMKDVTYKKV